MADESDEKVRVAPPEGDVSEEGEGAAGSVELVDDVHAALEAKVAELEARLRAVSAAYKQKQEEIEGTKERLARQASIQEEIRRGEVVASLFEPVENLHRSLEALKGQPVEGGLRMVYQQFMEAMRKLGLEEVPGAGAPFDPNLHEAIATQPVDTKERDNTILTVFSAGYRIGNRLIRPARVVIGSYSGGVAEA
ncbi:MAG: nucleotide exchange factor GrpE [Myxococcota bacterium]